MAKNYLITGYWGEPHVTSENDRGIHAAAFGKGRFVLPVGEQFRIEYIGNNTFRMYDGKLMDNGAAAGIPAGEYIDFVLPNAGQNEARMYLIVFQYSRDAATLIERGEFIVIETEDLSEIIQSDLLSGNATLDQFPLWTIVVTGTDFSEPYCCFEVSKSLANCAPSGYGLGENAPLVTDLNDATENGWYYFTSETLNRPAHIDEGSVLVLKASGYIAQQVFGFIPGSLLENDYLKAQRIRYPVILNSTWSVWEYENPPMKADVEYRTTERWLGKPVYTKLVEYTATSNIGNSGSSYGFSVSFSTPNFKNLIRYCGTIEGTGRAIPCFYNPEEGGGYIGLNFMNTQGVAVEMNKVTLTAGTKLLIQVWYVKN